MQVFFFSSNLTVFFSMFFPFFVVCSFFLTLPFETYSLSDHSVTLSFLGGVLLCYLLNFPSLVCGGLFLHKFFIFIVS